MHTNIAAINTFGKIAVLRIKSIVDGGVGLAKNTTTPNSNKFQAQKWFLPKRTKFLVSPLGAYLPLARLTYSGAPDSVLNKRGQSVDLSHALIKLW